jgi:hypothetical protein
VIDVDVDNMDPFENHIWLFLKTIISDFNISVVISGVKMAEILRTSNP